MSRITTAYYCLLGALAKARWRGQLAVDGRFRKRKDTQIIIEDGRIRVGNGVTFQRNVSLSAVAGGQMTLGNGVSLNRNCIFICRKEITIGDHVIFGPGVTIYDHDHNFSDKGILPGYKLSPVIIGEGCWIGANVTILRGTHIGAGCVIGAGTIVKGDIPPHSLVTSGRDIRIVQIEDRNKAKMGE